MNTLGRYEIVGEIGRGACGVVYRALDPRIRRDVAIKTIPTHELRSFEGGEQLYERLCREAQSAGILNHPGIVTVYELDETADLTYIVMEFVDGSTLRDLMNEPGGVSRERAVDVISQTASALDFAHKKGIVHRDVKPANIMIDSGGAVKITDFGVAKMLAAASTTQTGMAVGTPHYMSPEQIYAKAIDGRADQFALAVIAFELLTGKKPFDADSLPAIIHQILTVDRPSDEDLLKLGSRVAQALSKALAKKPEDRFATCFEFAAALRSAVEGKLDATSTIVAAALPLAAAAPPPPARPARPALRAPLLVAGAVALLGAGWLGYKLLNSNPAASSPVPAVPSASVAAEPKPVPPPVAEPKPERLKPEQPKPEAPKPAPPKEIARKEVPKKPAEEAKPEPPRPAEAELPVFPAVAAGEYYGAPEGRFSWSGSLGAGRTLQIAANRARTGAIAGRGLPQGVRVTATVSPGDLRIVEQPSAANGFRLGILNPTDREVTALSVAWEIAR